MFSETWTVSDCAFGVAPSLMTAVKPSAAFWSAPVAVWTYFTLPSIKSCWVKIEPTPIRSPFSVR